MPQVIDHYEYNQTTGEYDPVYVEVGNLDNYLTNLTSSNPATNLNDPNFWIRYGLTPNELNRQNGQTPGVGTGTSSNFLDTITNILSGRSGQGAQLAGTLGLTALLNATGNNGQQGIYKGYQGGIPNYTASRTQLPIPTTIPVAATTTSAATTAPRRPGQGGITYFSPMQYAVTPTPTPTPTPTAMAAGGGISTLGGYSDGGRLLRGPGDGVSDSIPATIGDKQPARLADGEFVIPARIVSEIGNGSSEAGARKLYAMMDRVQGARKKSLKNVAANTKADKYLPT